MTTWRIADGTICDFFSDEKPVKAYVPRRDTLPAMGVLANRLAASRKDAAWPFLSIYLTVSITHVFALCGISAYSAWIKPFGSSEEGVRRGKSRDRRAAEFRPIHRPSPRPAQMGLGTGRSTPLRSTRGISASMPMILSTGSVSGTLNDALLDGAAGDDPVTLDAGLLVGARSVVVGLAFLGRRDRLDAPVKFGPMPPPTRDEKTPACRRR
ncbi:MAG: hypothetical protein ACLT98_08650 [Eggerthellaceae bacterium]